MTDEFYIKRHQKYENEEKQIKRWDIRRQREELERIKLLKGRNKNKDNNNTNNNSNVPNIYNSKLNHHHNYLSLLFIKFFV